MSENREVKGGFRPGDSLRLRVLADWLDADDARKGRTGSEVQTDLRRIADSLASHPSIEVERVREKLRMHRAALQVGTIIQEKLPYREDVARNLRQMVDSVDEILSLLPSSSTQEKEAE